MPETDDRLAEAEHNMDVAQGYVRDAEFREDLVERNVRYLQAISHCLMALYQQNLAVIETLRGQQEQGGPI